VKPNSLKKKVLELFQIHTRSLPVIMTTAVTARIAGATFLLYIAAGMTTMLSSPATGGLDTAAKLVVISQHAQHMRLTVLLGFVGMMCAFVLGVALRSLTRRVDPDLATFGLCCRVAKGILGAVPILATLSLLELSKTPSPGNPLTDLLFSIQGWTTLTSATLFAMGSTIFSWLLLRGRLIPLVLSWLGVGASLLLVIALPLQLAGFLGGTITGLVWIPMLLFEIPLAIWLLAKGVADQVQTLQVSQP
jgi:hypothetical protein